MFPMYEDDYEIKITKYYYEREQFVLDTQLGGKQNVKFVVRDTITFDVIGEIYFHTNFYKAKCILDIDEDIYRMYSVFQDADMYIEYRYDELKRKMMEEEKNEL